MSDETRRQVHFKVTRRSMEYLKAIINQRGGRGNRSTVMRAAIEAWRTNRLGQLDLAELESLRRDKRSGHARETADELVEFKLILNAEQRDTLWRIRDEWRLPSLSEALRTCIALLYLHQIKPPLGQ